MKRWIGPEKTKTSNKTILLVVLLTNFINPFAISSLNVSTPVIGTEFHVAATSLGWIVSAFTFCTVALTIPAGRIADLLGRRIVFIYGLAIFSFGSGLGIFASSMNALIICRAIQGVGVAMIFATNIALLVSTFPQETRGKVLGMSSAAVYLGASLGPIAGGFLTHHFGWRSIMVLLCGIAVFSFIMAILCLPADGEKTRTDLKDKVDLKGIILYMLAALMIMYGLTVLTQNIISYFVLPFGVILLIIFVNYQSRIDNPLVLISMFQKNLRYVMANVAALFNFIPNFAVGYLLAIYIQHVLGFNADIAGLILMSQAIIQTIVSPFAGRLSDKVSPHLICSAGMGLCAIALFSFSMMETNTSVIYLITGLMFLGAGFGLFSSPNMNAVMSSVNADSYSMASSILSTARNMGNTTGMALVTIIANKIAGNVLLAEAGKEVIVHNVNLSFFVLGCVCVAGIILTFDYGALKKRNAV